MERTELKRIIEAALLAAGQPLPFSALAALFSEQETPSHEELAQAIEELTAECVDRGIELKEVASGFRYQIKNDVQPWVAKLWTERQTRYSRALLETLSLIAYRQPITRAEIEQIRGVAVSSNIIKTLEEREWIRVVGYRDMPGKPALFGTTKAFLDYFNLKSLDELPPLAEIRDIEEIEPQLKLEPAITASGDDTDGMEEKSAPSTDITSIDSTSGDDEELAAAASNEPPEFGESSQVSDPERTL